MRKYILLRKIGKLNLSTLPQISTKMVGSTILGRRMGSYRGRSPMEFLAPMRGSFLKGHSMTWRDYMQRIFSFERG